MPEPCAGSAGKDNDGFLARGHYTTQQKRELILEALKEDPGRSNRQIAVCLGVAPNTVIAQRRKLESTVQIEQLPKTVGADGRARTTQNLKKQSKDMARSEKAIQGHSGPLVWGKQPSKQQSR
jgi:hypothetical protein